MKKFICFKCGKEFEEKERCVNCTWLKCPFCGACLCSLSFSEKFVAIAVWLSNADLDKETYQGWYNYLIGLKTVIER